MVKSNSEYFLPVLAVPYNSEQNTCILVFFSSEMFSLNYIVSFAVTYYEGIIHCYVQLFAIIVI